MGDRLHRHEYCIGSRGRPFGRVIIDLMVRWIEAFSFIRLNTSFIDTVISCAMKSRLLIRILLLASCSASAKVLVQHDYDALGDRVTSVAVHPGEHLSQSFTSAAVASPWSAI